MAVPGGGVFGFGMGGGVAPDGGGVAPAGGGVAPAGGGVLTAGGGVLTAGGRELAAGGWDITAGGRRVAGDVWVAVWANVVAAKVDRTSDVTNVFINMDAFSLL
jgi:hypothetical protein